MDYVPGQTPIPCEMFALLMLVRKAQEKLQDQPTAQWLYKLAGKALTRL